MTADFTPDDIAAARLMLRRWERRPEQIAQQLAAQLTRALDALEATRAELADCTDVRAMIAQAERDALDLAAELVASTEGA